LENVIERAVINTHGSTLNLADKLETPQEADFTTDRKSLKEVERDCIMKVLEETNWKIEGKNGAASILGLNPSTLRGRMRNLDIRRK
jgi:chemotaxis protein methyltransferase CheR